MWSTLYYEVIYCWAIIWGIQSFMVYLNKHNRVVWVGNQLIWYWFCFYGLGQSKLSIEKDFLSLSSDLVPLVIGAVPPKPFALFIW